MKNNALLKNLFITFNHSEGTRRAYVYALEKYATYFEMELDELLREDEKEESEEPNGNTEKSNSDYGLQTVPT